MSVLWLFRTLCFCTVRSDTVFPHLAFPHQTYFWEHPFFFLSSFLPSLLFFFLFFPSLLSFFLFSFPVFFLSFILSYFTFRNGIKCREISKSIIVVLSIFALDLRDLRFKNVDIQKVFHGHESRSIIFAIISFNGKYKNLRMTPKYCCASSYHSRNINN